MPIRVRIPAIAPGAMERVVDLADGVSEIRIGSHPELELPLPLAAISALHARIFRDPGEGGAGWLVEDLGSASGTRVGSFPLAAGVPAPLPPGAELAVGPVVLVFEGQAPPAPNAEGTATIARRLVRDLFAGEPRGAAPEIEVVAGPEPGRRLALREADRPYLVGRGAACDLALVVEEISREHAAFVWTGEGVVVRDLGSKNGLSVAGARVDGTRRLRDGDLVELGLVTLRLDDAVDRYLRELEAPASERKDEPPRRQGRRGEGVETGSGPRSSSRPLRLGGSSSSALPTAVAVAALAIVAAAAVALYVAR